MHIFVLTLFPEMFSSPFSYSILKRAQEKKLLQIELVNIRDFSTDRYQTVDDKPYGGGRGMILRVDVIDKALNFAKNKIARTASCRTILLDPKGTGFTQSYAWQLGSIENVILICGRYEGVDARVYKLVDESVSIGHYVVSGGELPAMVMVDAVARLIPGVLGKADSNLDESFATDQYLEYPQYTRPAVYKKFRVPKTLLSGNHEKINRWRKNKSTYSKTKSLRVENAVTE